MDLGRVGEMQIHNKAQHLTSSGQEKRLLQQQQIRGIHFSVGRFATIQGAVFKQLQHIGLSHPHPTNHPPKPPTNQPPPPPIIDEAIVSHDTVLMKHRTI